MELWTREKFNTYMGQDREENYQAHKEAEWSLSSILMAPFALVILVPIAIVCTAPIWWPLALVAYLFF